jgi:hypothetical protein
LLHQALIALSDDEATLQVAVTAMVLVGDKARRGARNSASA